MISIKIKNPNVLERIYYVKCDKDFFYLIIDDLKGYFKYSKEKDTAELSSLERRKNLILL